VIWALTIFEVVLSEVAPIVVLLSETMLFNHRGNYTAFPSASRSLDKFEHSGLCASHTKDKCDSVHNRRLPEPRTLFDALAFHKTDKVWPFCG
jgi:hypothetical protein